MHLTPNQRMEIVSIYLSLAPCRSLNRANVTSQIATQQKIFITPLGVKKIMKKWHLSCNILFYFQIVMQRL